MSELHHTLRKTGERDRSLTQGEGTEVIGQADAGWQCKVEQGQGHCIVVLFLSEW